MANPNQSRRKKIPSLLLILIVFFGCFIAARPATCIKIGADEDYELSKALLYTKGFHFYMEIWNDQPLLHTALVGEALKHIGSSALVPRAITFCFSALLIISFFSFVRSISGELAATIAASFLLFSPGFIDLSSSCMVEIPALAPAVAGLTVLKAFHRGSSKVALFLAGALFGVAFQIKLINVILLPLVAEVIWLNRTEGGRGETASSQDQAASRLFHRKLCLQALFDFGLFCSSLAIAFFTINSFLLDGSYLFQLKQTWSAHFASTQSFEYGSPADYRFDWLILLKNWDQTIPCLIGAFICMRQGRYSLWLLIPVTWLGLECFVFGMHTPWWSYYYIHNAIPITFCAGIAVATAIEHLRSKRSPKMLVTSSLFIAAASAWMVSRACLQISAIRHSPQTYNSLVLSTIQQFKPFTQFMYTDEGVYSFHAGIPLPPKLAIVSLKRFWSGDMTNEKLREELSAVKPGMILLANNNQEIPYKDLLQSFYSLTYEDTKRRLYVRKDVVKQANW